MSANGAFPKGRVEAFSDGVIAIIVTILVLEVRVPHLEGPDLEAAAWHAMREALPLVGAYVVSFLVLLVFWVSHHHLLHALRAVDRTFLWLNGVFLMLLAFVPAPTALLGEYPGVRAASVLYGATLALAGLSFAALRWHVTHRARLLHEAISRAEAGAAIRRGLVSPVLYGLGALLAFLDPRLSWAVYALLPLLFMRPAGFDRAVHRLTD